MVISEKEIKHYINELNSKSDADYSREYGETLAEIIMFKGSEVIKPLKEAGADFSKLYGKIWGSFININYLSQIIKTQGPEVIEPLKEISIDFSKLYSWELSEIITVQGIEIIKPLKEAGADFSKLGYFDLMDIVESKGLEVIKPLKEVGADLSKLYGDSLSEIMKAQGAEVIKPDLSDIDYFYARSLGIETKKWGSFININYLSYRVKSQGSEILKHLKEAGADFSNIDDWDLKDIIITIGPEVIKPLKEAGADFSKINDLDLRYIKYLRPEVIEPLKEIGIDLSDINYENMEKRDIDNIRTDSKESDVKQYTAPALLLGSESEISETGEAF